ncbi:MazG nucleotide pyrophosphohydrolase domain-containing protein [Treponema phagedenis]|uniref:MazG nucleotide pyrophosphohydrolase domain n=1 Tax=Treponema phagedenis TaxID=162 RepID=A0A0B7H0R6_TREPH|nr:MazG nucleotide pyrophosphohydrolase domain-containing protein [Treponema phagedenis]QEJ94996.1 hypothetical protein FUT79_07140 [Treponema phagedenis]QEJ98297.1 hypothetical protein FUT82_09995 [Treponema phagedenis]QEK00927.1 hypothetical protein FUT84_07010 [Treponema phagedenis]QEK03807.1 hypothetical protein FUT83_08305 [Treponema phagedenis]QEK05935.1 hypothetical protein FUT80_03915 [Treponema phagedenis]
MIELLDKVKQLHKQNDFKANGGEDKLFRMALIMEEVGEISEAITKDQDNFEEEHADLLILLLGNCVAYDIDILKLTNEKLDRLLKMKPSKKNGYKRIITKENKR